TIDARRTRRSCHPRHRWSIDCDRTHGVVAPVAPGYDGAVKVALVSLLAACGDNAVLDFGAASSTFPATMPPLPQVISHGGPVMTGVHVVPIYFGADPERPQLDDFLAKYGASPYWPQQVGEYGVTGPLTIDPALVSNVAPPTDADTLKAFVQAELGTIDATTLGRTIYLLHFAESQVLDAGFGKSCEAFP